MIKPPCPQGTLGVVCVPRTLPLVNAPLRRTRLGHPQCTVGRCTVGGGNVHVSITLWLCVLAISHACYLLCVVGGRLVQAPT